MLRDESEKAGRRTGLICPTCVKSAFESPDEFDWDISLAVCPRNTNPHRVSSYLTRLLPKHFTDCRHQSM